MIIIRKYKRRINRKHKRKYKRKIWGRAVFGDAFRTLGSFGKLYYKALGGKWDEKKKLCRGKTECTKKSNTT